MQRDFFMVAQQIRHFVAESTLFEQEKQAMGNHFSAFLALATIPSTARCFVTSKWYLSHGFAPRPQAGSHFLQLGGSDSFFRHRRFLDG